MFHLCEATEWAVLPVTGGWYDQHPRLIDQWEVLFRAKARQQAIDKAKRDSEISRANAKKGRK